VPLALATSVPSTCTLDSSQASDFARWTSSVEHVGLRIAEQRAGYSRCTLTVAPHHFNGAGVVHGGVILHAGRHGDGRRAHPDSA
jgi:hypothetical protein